MATRSSVLFDDLFTVTDDGMEKRPYERVARVHAKSENHNMTLVLDVNCELLPLKTNETFTLTLASSLSTDPNDPSGDQPDAWRSNKPSLADDYEYVCHGQVYKFDESSEDTVTAYTSFGGLLMALSGSYRHMSSLTVGHHIYLLLRWASCIPLPLNAWEVAKLTDMLANLV